MADVFISYSRKDVDFVRQLHDVLKAHGRDTWVDWEGIPPTADWMAEIHAAIESAAIFVFVIGPHSTTSSVCTREVAHAIRHQKRLVPVVRHDVQPGDVPPELAALNWIFWRETDDPDVAAKLLLQAIDTDFDWVRMHTRLLVRAIEWEHAGKEPSFLLHGRDLADAEQQLLAGEGDKEPKPTPLQTHYIIASRGAATGRQRIVLAAVTAGLIVAVGLGLFAWAQRNEATYQAERATAQARVALARQLAAQATTSLDSKLDLALLLSVEGNRLSETRTVQGSLLAGLVSNPRLTAFLRGHTGAVRGVAFSPDGTRLASASDDATVRLWDAATGQPVGEPLVGHLTAVENVVFSPDGSTLASSSLDAIKLWDAGDGRPLPGPRTGPVAFTSYVAFSPDGRILATGTMDGSVQLWDVATGQPIDEPLEGHTDRVSAVAFNPDGTRLASASLDQTVRLWDVATCRPVGDPLQGHTSSVSSVAFSHDGARLATGGLDGKIRAWDAATGQPMGQPMGQGSPVYGIAFGPDDAILAAGSGDNTVRLWNLATGQEAAEPLSGHGAAVRGVAFGPGGRTLASSGADDTVILWSLAPTPTLARPMAGPPGSVGSVAFSPDGSLVASTARDDVSITLRSVVTGQPIGSPLTAHTAPPVGVTFSPDGTRLISGGRDQTIRLWDVATGQSTLQIETDHAGALTTVTVSPDGRTVASGGLDGTIRLWDAATGRPAGTPMEEPNTFIFTVAFSPDGASIASGSVDGKVRLWDVRTGQRIGEPWSSPSLVLGMAFSPDGTRLATGHNDSGIRVWDVAAGRPVGRPLTGHTAGVTTVAFSPDGRTLASGGLDKTIILWDVATGQPIGRPLSGTGAAVSSLAFSPDGTRLASGVSNRGVILWSLDPAEWQLAACTRAGRNLSEVEWAQYLPDQPYRATCPSALLGEAEVALRAGRADQASAVYAQAAELAATLGSPIFDNQVCRRGSLAGFAEQVMAACNRAVRLAPDEGRYRDSRGLARALTGDRRGAAEDFQAFVNWSHAHYAYESDGPTREAWIAELEAGRDPIDGAIVRNAEVTP